MTDKQLQSEFDLRGLLAAKLSCWHRLTGAESDELVAFVARLEQPEQEPVFSFRMQLQPGFGGQYPRAQVLGRPDIESLFGKIGDVVTFYTTPPAAPVQEHCLHRIADARNPVVKSGYICVDCGALFSAAGHEVAPPAQPAPVQEPYGYVSTHTNGLMHFSKTFHGVYTDTATEIVAVYTTPPAAQPAQQESNESDDLIRNLGLDPEQFRTDAGFINHMKLRAAIQHPEEYPAYSPLKLKWCHVCGLPNPDEGMCNHGAAQPAQQDIPDLIAGALGVSRGTAYDLMREALAEQAAQGCDYCNHPLYSGIKCKNCGRRQPAQQEPVANASTWFALVMNAAAELEDASHCLRDEDAKRTAISGAKHYRDAAKALYTTPPAAQPEERNFCSRCGKRTADLTAIHTCTPPQENTLDTAPPAQPAVPQWIAVSDFLPLEEDGEVLVRMLDGRHEIAWATYWHGASNAFAQWTFRDPDENETPTHWVKITAHGITKGQL